MFTIKLNQIAWMKYKAGTGVSFVVTTAQAVAKMRHVAKIEHPSHIRGEAGISMVIDLGVAIYVSNLSVVTN